MLCGIFAWLYRFIVLGILIAILALSCLTYMNQVSDRDTTAARISSLQKSLDKDIANIMHNVTTRMDSKLEENARDHKAELNTTLNELFSHSDDSVGE